MNNGSQDDSDNEIVNEPESDNPEYYVSLKNIKKQVISYNEYP